jgi:hypothetical protein
MTIDELLDNIGSNLGLDMAAMDTSAPLGSLPLDSIEIVEVVSYCLSWSAHPNLPPQLDPADVSLRDLHHYLFDLP